MDGTPTPTQPAPPEILRELDDILAMARDQLSLVIAARNGVVCMEGSIGRLGTSGRPSGIRESTSIPRLNQFIDGTLDEVLAELDRAFDLLDAKAPPS